MSFILPLHPDTGAELSILILRIMHILFDCSSLRSVPIGYLGTLAGRELDGERSEKRFWSFWYRLILTVAGVAAMSFPPCGPFRQVVKLFL